MRNYRYEKQQRIIMPLITPPIKNISEVTEPLKEQILNGNVHTLDEGMVEAFRVQRYDKRGGSQFHLA